MAKMGMWEVDKRRKYRRVMGVKWEMKIVAAIVVCFDVRRLKKQRVMK